MKHLPQTSETEKLLEHIFDTSRSTFATSLWNTCSIPLKHLKRTLATCIVSRCGLLHCLHQGVAAIAGGEARGLPLQGPTLLLAQRPQWLAGGQGSSRHAWARRCPCRQAKRAAKQKSEGWCGGAGKEQRGVTVDDRAGRREGAAGRPAGSPSTCRAERSRPLVLFSFPYSTGVTKETNTNTIIKK
jgi:hypothetical protein